MTPGRSRPLYAGGALGVCCVTSCASAGIACATAVAAAANAGNAFIIWRRFMAVSPGIAFVRSALLYAVPRRNPAVWMRLARDARESDASVLDVMPSVVNELHRGIESFRAGPARRRNAG